MVRSSLVASIAMLMCALIVAAPASASEALTGAGAGTIEQVSITIVRTADGNVIQERNLNGTVTGSLQGTFVEDVRGVIHPTGLVTFEGQITFTGSVAGCGSGTLTLGISGQGVTGTPVTQARIRVIDAGSNTIPAHGEGTLDQVGPALTYQMRYQC